MINFFPYKYYFSVYIQILFKNKIQMIKTMYNN